MLHRHPYLGQTHDSVDARLQKSCNCNIVAIISAAIAVTQLCCNEYHWPVMARPQSAQIPLILSSIESMEKLEGSSFGKAG